MFIIYVVKEALICYSINKWVVVYIKKLKVSIIGSCVTRGIFNSKFISNYKELYECTSTAWQTSIISFMSDKAKIDEKQMEITGEVSKLQKKTIARDLDKSYKNELIEIQPDYIIFDLYTDVKYGAVKTNNGYLTNNPNGFRKTVYYKEKHYEKGLNIFRDEEYFDLFFDNFSRFNQWVNRNIPNCRIIITKFSEAFSYINKKGYAVNYSPKVCEKVARDNKMYTQMYEKLAEEFDVDFIEMQNQTYFGDIDHIFGNKPWHFTQEYYDDLYKRLNEIVLKYKLLSEEEEQSQTVSQFARMMEKIKLKMK